MITIRRAEFNGINKLTAYFEDVDEMLEAKSNYEQDQLDNVDELDDIVHFTNYEYDGEYYTITTQMFSKYILN